MIRSNKLFPVALVGIMVLLTFWLDQITRLSTFSRGINLAKPEFAAEEISIVRFTPQGQRQEKIIATRAWQFPKKHIIHFDSMLLNAFKAGQLDYTLASDSGQYNSQTKLAFFDRQVIMQQPPTPQQPATKLVTSAMHLDTEHAIASSSTPITIYYGTSVANAVGFRYDYHLRQMYLLSHARIIYEE